MVDTAGPLYKEYAIEEFLVRAEPYYRAIGDEEALFTAAYHQQQPASVDRRRRGGPRR